MIKYTKQLTITLTKSYDFAILNKAFLCKAV